VSNLVERDGGTTCWEHRFVKQLLSHWKLLVDVKPHPFLWTPYEKFGCACLPVRVGSTIASYIECNPVPVNGFPAHRHVSSDRRRRECNEQTPRHSASSFRGADLTQLFEPQKLNHEATDRQCTRVYFKSAHENPAVVYRTTRLWSRVLQRGLELFVEHKTGYGSSLASDGSSRPSITTSTMSTCSCLLPGYPTISSCRSFLC
jgi:hypothetical protein